MKLPKNAYIGTGAWFFMIINLIKVPMQVVFWHGITWSSLGFDLLLVPAIICGAWLGVKAVKALPEKPFRLLVIILTAASALKLFF